MTAQDDTREREMRTLFNLVRHPNASRGGIDAVLHLNGAAIPDSLRGREVPFELKSATSGQPKISTVRDFGPHHVEKWRDLHWLFAVYAKGAVDDGPLYCLYGSPAQMRPWLDEKSAYVAADTALTDCVPSLITPATLDTVLGSAERFTKADAKRLMKRQYSAAQYAAASDLPDGGYSRAAMLEMLRERCRYVIERGSTLNNPHISASYFAGWERIEADHASRLRELVVEALSD